MAIVGLLPGGRLQGCAHPADLPAQESPLHKRVYLCRGQVKGGRAKLDPKSCLRLLAEFKKSVVAGTVTPGVRRDLRRGRMPSAGLSRAVRLPSGLLGSTSSPLGIIASPLVRIAQGFVGAKQLAHTLVGLWRTIDVGVRTQS